MICFHQSQLIVLCTFLAAVQTNMTTVKWFHTYIWGLLFVK